MSVSVRTIVNIATRCDLWPRFKKTIIQADFSEYYIYEYSTYIFRVVAFR